MTKQASDDLGTIVISNSHRYRSPNTESCNRPSMKPPTLFLSLLVSIAAASQLPLQRLQAVKPAGAHQAPMMSTPNIALPPSDKQDPPSNPSGEVIISDVIGKDRIINIFAGFTRDIEAISKRLDDNTQNTTVLAPLNSEMSKLPRKPWENPKDFGALGQNAYDGADGEDRAHRNLRRFVEAHIVPASPWKEGEKISTLGGTKVWWETKGGKKTVGAANPRAVTSSLTVFANEVQPGDIEVSSIANKVANGEVWILKGVINYE